MGARWLDGRAAGGARVGDRLGDRLGKYAAKYGEWHTVVCPELMKDKNARLF